MATLRKRTTIVPIAIGFALLQLAKMPDAFGDLARVQGNVAGATGFHLLALAVDLAGLGCFVFALIHIVRHFRGGGGDDDATPAPVRPTPVAAAPAFDPDAVMARYLATRGAAPTAPRGFGRKRD